MKDIKDYSVEYYEGLANSLHKKSASSSEGGSLGSNHDCDWNTMKSKPFYEEITYGDTLTWDGNTEGLESVNVYSELPMYHVSDSVPTKEKLLTTVLFKASDGTEDGIPSEAMSESVLEDGFAFLEYFAVVPTDNYTTEAGVFPKKGVYLANLDGYFLQSLTINGYNGFPMKGIKQLDNKYLEPFETVGGDTLTWDGNTEGLAVVDMSGGAGSSYVYLLTDAYPTLTEVQNGVSATLADVGALTLTATDMTAQLGCECYMLMFDTVPVALGISQDAETPVGTMKKGLYAYTTELRTLTINGYTGFTTTKLKPECLPYTDAESEVF